MRKKFIKKFLAAGVILLFLSTVFGVATPDFDKTKTKLSCQKLNHIESLSNDHLETVTFSFVLRSPSPTANRKVLSMGQRDADTENSVTLYEFELPIADAESLQEQVDLIDHQMKIEKNPENMKNLANQKLQLYMDYNILPMGFTYENLSIFLEEIATSFLNTFQHDVDFNTTYTKQTKSSGGLTLNFAAPASCLAYFTLAGVVTPKGVCIGSDGIMFNAIPIINMSIINVTVNATGVYFSNISLSDNGFGFGRLLEQVGPFKFGGPIWAKIWEKRVENDPNAHLEYRMFWALAHYNFIHALIGNAITLGVFAGLQLDGRDLTPKLAQFYLGNFVWVGSPWTFPFSFTIYRSWPQPWTVSFDLGVVPCIGVSGLVSLFSLSDPYYPQ